MKLFKIIKSNSGIALLMAVSTLSLLLFIIVETTYDTNVEYSIHGQSVNRIKAQAAARSGIELALLRIKIYKKVNKQFGAAINNYRQYVEQIWQLPFMWPPLVPDEVNAVDRDLLKKSADESLMGASYRIIISEEGSRVDINDLASKSKVLRESTRKSVRSILEVKANQDNGFMARNSLRNIEDLINNITDWVDADNVTSGGNQSEGYLYTSLKTGGLFTYPPNRAFRSLGELKMVAGMTNEIFELLEPLVTVYGMRSINPNVASKDVLISLDSNFGEKAAEEVIKRRQTPSLGGPFKESKEFWAFVRQFAKGPLSPDVESGIPLSFEGLINFRIVSTGSASEATSEITAIVFDSDEIASINNKFISEENKQGNPESNPSSEPLVSPSVAQKRQQEKTSQIAKGPPQIIYWSER